MSKLFDEALAKARVEAKRTRRDIAIIRETDQFDGVFYDLDFADDHIDDEDVVHTVAYRWVPAYTNLNFPGESAGTGRDGIDEFIDVLRDLFGENRPVTRH